jgi:hypothetical protein
MSLPIWCCTSIFSRIVAPSLVTVTCVDVDVDGDGDGEGDGDGHYHGGGDRDKNRGTIVRQSHLL